MSNAADDASQRTALLQNALEQLTAAKAEYTKGFGREDHPKVAWALGLNLLQLEGQEHASAGRNAHTT